MVGHKPNIYWQVTWRFISPLIVFVIFCLYLVTKIQEELTYLVWDPEYVSTRNSLCCPQFTFLQLYSLLFQLMCHVGLLIHPDVYILRPIYFFHHLPSFHPSIHQCVYIYIYRSINLSYQSIPTHQFWIIYPCFKRSVYNYRNSRVARLF